MIPIGAGEIVKVKGKEELCLGAAKRALVAKKNPTYK